MTQIAIFDIGKSNAKLTITTSSGDVLAEFRRPNQVKQGGPYPCADVESLWAWLVDSLQSYPDTSQISQFVTTTHGATAALVNEQGLRFPVMDYEWVLPDISGYAAVRPAFSETCSPDLPAGLNLGRQLFWLAQHYPGQFREVKHILMYPQYWGWRLTGVAVSEVTSLGCHTDLWSPANDDYSSLVTRMQWQHLFPPITKANSVIGRIRPSIAAVTGLSEHCEVIAGIHDSNASLLPYLPLAQTQPVTVLSSGTWLIMANIGGAIAKLDESADMLANVSMNREPVACARFMAGREFAVLMQGSSCNSCDTSDVAKLIHQNAMVLPSFSEIGGPFIGQRGCIVHEGELTEEERFALTTLYLACVTNYCLNLLGTTGLHIIEGSLAGNPLFARLLAALHKERSIVGSADTAGTTIGALHLCQATVAKHQLYEPAVPLLSDDIKAYYGRWLARAQSLLG